jgi:hypothetical protein
MFKEIHLEQDGADLEVFGRIRAIPTQGAYDQGKRGFQLSLGGQDTEESRQAPIERGILVAAYISQSQTDQALQRLQVEAVSPWSRGR